jgi:RND family efflux transporter MFP subunit
MMGMSYGVLTLMNLAKVKITLDVPSEDIEKIKIGQPCKVTVNTLPGETFDGEIYSRNLAADEVSKTFKVEVRVENPGIKIKAGIFAEVAIEISKDENVLLLPVSAIMHRDGSGYVVLYNNGTAKYKDVKTGGKNDRFVHVSDGLEEGELVVVEGNYDLKEGNPVTKKNDE